MFSSMTWSGATVVALASPFCWPVSVRMLTLTLAARAPVFIRYSRTSGAPEPTNHMSELGCEQLTRPMPDEVACSASNPSAIRPVTASAVPAASPADGAVTVVAVPGSETVTGAADALLVTDAVLAGVFLPLAGFVAAGAADAAGTALSVAEPAEAAVEPLAAAD